jgi:hypothetical protein
MNCFNHPHSSATGICRVCCRGLCTECAVDLGHSLACKGEHEQGAAAINALNLRSTKLLKVTRKSMFIGPLFFGVCGLIFLVDGLRQEVRLNFASYLGAAFVVFALAILVTNVRAYGEKRPTDS